MAQIILPDGKNYFVDDSKLHPEQVKAIDENTISLNEKLTKPTPNEPANRSVESAPREYSQKPQRTQEVTQGVKYHPMK